MRFAPLAAALAGAQLLFAASAPAGLEKKEPVTAVVEGLPPGVKAGQTFEVRVRLTIAPTFHINSAKPDDEFLIPTKVEPAGGPFKLVSATYPKPKVAKLSISEKPAKIYEGSPVITLKLKAQPGAEKARELRVKIRYQACDDEVCYPPKDLTVAGKIGK